MLRQLPGTARLLCGLFLLPIAPCLPPRAMAQIDFSANIVNLRHPETPYQTKIYSTKGKLRFEGHNRQGAIGSIMLVDLTTRRSIVLRPQRHMYVEQEHAQ